MKKRKSVTLTVFLIIVLLIASVGIFMISFRETNTADTPSHTDQNGETSQSTESTDAPDMNEQDVQDRIAEIDAILNDPYMILVNVDHGVGEDYKPNDLVTIQDKNLEKTAAAQLKLMLSAADEAGMDTINIYSAYRNYTRQQTNYNNKVNYYLGEGYGQERAEELAAAIVNPPGKSEHQTGLAADICTADIVNRYASLHEDFEFTDEYKWLYEHCAEYGFILRYPKDKVEVTGISFEPWHYRYVGKTHAKEIMDRKICLEEYIEQLQKEKASLEK